MSLGLFYSGQKISAAPVVPVEKSGTLASSETWSGVIHVTDDVVVPDGVTLTIEAGTSVEFAGAFWIESIGSIVAVGNASNRISFKTRSDFVGKWYSVLCGESVDGFNMSAPSASSTYNFQYCDFEDASKDQRNTVGHVGHKNGAAIMFYGAENITIDNCGFYRMTSVSNGAAIYYQGLSPFDVPITISNCYFEDCTSGNVAACALAHPDTTVFDNLTFSNCINDSSWGSKSLTADVGADTLSIGGTHYMQTGFEFKILSGTPPAPLALNTEYYAIRVSSSTFKLATSLANANAGTAINLTTAGSGMTCTLLYTLHVFDPQGSVTRS